jgi:hypothetical protein|tara:strand:- start:324 stop:629 length:306 start_codon:yes stop_codon:yes gene_type:complete
MNYFLENTKTIPKESFTVQVFWNIDEDEIVEYPPHIQIDNSEIEKIRNKYCPDYDEIEHRLSEQQIQDILLDMCDDLTDDIEDKYDCQIKGFQMVNELEIN